MRQSQEKELKISATFPPAAHVAGISESHGDELLKHLDGQYFLKKKRKKESEAKELTEEVPADVRAEYENDMDLYLGFTV